jgi:lipid-A-disaccharide synthase
MGKLLVKIPNIGLINIVAGSRIVPELWQNEVTAEKIAGHLLQFITDKQLHNSVVQSLCAAKDKLGLPGAARRAASIALEMIA